MPQASLTVAEYLGAIGYDTAAFIDNPNIAARIGLDQGFARFDTAPEQIPKTDWNGGIRLSMSLALSALEESREGSRSFLFVHGLDAHAPYSPDPAFIELGLAACEKLFPQDNQTPIAAQHGTIFGAIPEYVVKEKEAELPAPPLTWSTRMETIQHLATLRQIDADLEAFVEELRKGGFLDNSLLIISADHGESMTTDDCYFSHQTTQDEVSNIPLLIRCPPAWGLSPKTIDSPMGMVDLFPTLVELLSGVDPGSSLDGQSLLPVLKGDKGTKGFAFAQSFLFEERALLLPEGRVTWTVPSPANGGEIAFLSSPYVRDALQEEIGWPREQVIGTRAFPLDQVYADLLANGQDPALLWKSIQARFQDPIVRVTPVDDTASLAQTLLVKADLHRKQIEALIQGAKADLDRSAGGAPPSNDSSGTKAALRQLGY